MLILPDFLQLYNNAKFFLTFHIVSNNVAFALFDKAKGNFLYHALACMNNIKEKMLYIFFYLKKALFTNYKQKL